MAILTSPAGSAFDNLSPANGTLTARSSDSIAITFSPVGSKQQYTLKLFGAFDAQGNIDALTNGAYNLPDASAVSLSFPASTGRILLEASSGTLRVDRLIESLLRGDDWLTLGDQADWVNAGAGSDYIDTNGGADRVQGGPGDDFIAGGAGIDTAEYSGPRSQFSIAYSSNGFNITDQTGSEGVDTLSAVERLRFDDVRVALDLDANAGQVAKLLGAVFGAKAVVNREYMGIGLSLLDGGMGYAALAELAVSVTGASAPADVVKLLWTNVIGSAPTTQDAQPFVDMLNGGMSIGQLTVMAADTTLNAVSIDLVGLAKTGVEFIEMS